MRSRRRGGAMELLRRHGINHLDTAASYGESQKKGLELQNGSHPLYQVWIKK